MNNITIIKIITEKALAVNLAGKHHVFVDIAGHVNSITVRAYKGGWSEELAELGPTYTCHCYYNSDECKPYLDNMLEVVDAYLNNDEANMNKQVVFDTDDMFGAL